MSPDVIPLLADKHGAPALDASEIAPARTDDAVRLASRPYPAELEEQVSWGGRSVLLRPIRPEDFAQHKRFLAQVSPEDMRLRFFACVRELPDRDLAGFTQLDYERQMAFIAVARGAEGLEETLGVARAATDADNIEAEFAVLVRSDLKGHGLGRLLLDKLVRYCRDRGARRLTGEILSQNTRMIHLAADLGFGVTLNGRDPLTVSLDLTSSLVSDRPREGCDKPAEGAPAR
jgi:acetyltransferase